jgi:hypothetical protein
MTNFETWAMANSDRVFRYWVYRRMFTPYEQEQKFTDETVFEDNHCSYGTIREAVELPDGDVLIGFTDPFDDTVPEGSLNIHYLRLSEIRLAYYPRDEAELREEDSDWREE